MRSIYKLSSANQSLDFPRYREEPTKYIIASQPRCGSHLLCQLLYVTRKAGCPLEYFNPRHWQEWRARCKSDNASYVVRMLMQRRTSVNGVFGVKTHWNHFEDLIQQGVEMHFHDAKFIYLVREDVLGQAISHVIALQTGQWVSSYPKKKEPMYSYEEISRSIALILTQRQRWETFFCAAGVLPYRVTYESLLRNQDEHLGQVLKFLNVLDYTKSINDHVEVTMQRTEGNDRRRDRCLAGAAIRKDERHKWKVLLEEHGAIGKDSRS